MHLAEIAVLLLGKAGRHPSDHVAVPANITLLPRPPKCPERTVLETVGLFRRDKRLSNRIFQAHDDIVDHCCNAWNRLDDQPWPIRSIRLRNGKAAPRISDMR